MTEVIRMLTEALNVLRTAPMSNAAAIHYIEEALKALRALSDTSQLHNSQGE